MAFGPGRRTVWPFAFKFYSLKGSSERALENTSYVNNVTLENFNNPEPCMGKNI